MPYTILPIYWNQNISGLCLAPWTSGSTVIAAITVGVCASVLHSWLTWVKLTNTLLAVTQSTHWKIIHKLWRSTTDVLSLLEHLLYALWLISIDRTLIVSHSCPVSSIAVSLCALTAPKLGTPGWLDSRLIMHCWSGTSYHRWYKICDHFKDHVADMSKWHWTEILWSNLCLKSKRHLRPKPLPVPSIYWTLEHNV